MLRVVTSSLMLIAISGCGLTRTPPPPEAGDTSLAAAEQMDAIAALMDAGDTAAARNQLEQALADGLEHPRAFDLAGRFATRDGDHQAAIDWYRKAVASAPLWLEPRLALAKAFMDAERPLAAASVYADLDRMFPRHPAGPYGQAAIALGRGADAEAAPLISEALKRDSDFLPAIALAVRMARANGDAAGERRLLQRVLGLRPNSPRTLARLASLDIAEGRLEDARRGLLRALDIQPDPGIAAQLANLEQLLERREHNDSL